MKIKREELPLGEDKAPLALPQYRLQYKTGAKKLRVCTKNDQTYQSGGQKIRVQLRSHTSSPTDLPDEQGKEANDTDPTLSTTACPNARLEGMGEEEDIETVGTTPPDSSGILLAITCCKYGPTSDCKTQQCICQKA